MRAKGAALGIASISFTAIWLTWATPYALITSMSRRPASVCAADTFARSHVALLDSLRLPLSHRFHPTSLASTRDEECTTSVFPLPPSREPQLTVNTSTVEEIADLFGDEDDVVLHMRDMKHNVNGGFAK